jgi:hypothetical protein
MFRKESYPECLSILESALRILLHVFEIDSTQVSLFVNTYLASAVYFAEMASRRVGVSAAVDIVSAGRLFLDHYASLLPTRTAMQWEMAFQSSIAGCHFAARSFDSAQKSLSRVARYVFGDVHCLLDELLVAVNLVCVFLATKNISDLETYVHVMRLMVDNEQTVTCDVRASCWDGILHYRETSSRLLLGSACYLLSVVEAAIHNDKAAGIGYANKGLAILKDLSQGEAIRTELQILVEVLKTRELGMSALRQHQQEQNDELVRSERKAVKAAMPKASSKTQEAFQLPPLTPRSTADVSRTTRSYSMASLSAYKPKMKSALKTARTKGRPTSSDVVVASGPRVTFADSKTASDAAPVNLYQEVDQLMEEIEEAERPMPQSPPSVNDKPALVPSPDSESTISSSDSTDHDVSELSSSLYISPDKKPDSQQSRPPTHENPSRQAQQPHPVDKADAQGEKQPHTHLQPMPPAQPMPPTDGEPEVGTPRRSFWARMRGMFGKKQAAS